MPVGEDVHKLLICGDVKGKFKALFSRVNNVIKAAGSFNMLLCLGEFFGENAEESRCLFDGYVDVPIPTYVVSPIPESLKSLCAGNESQNLTFLGSQGMYTTLSGLRIVYICSIDNEHDGLSESSTFLSSALAAEDIGFVGVDLLLTTQWPYGVDKHTTFPLSDEFKPCLSTGSKTISKLAFFLQPRYHFSSGKGCYYERPPYRNHRVLQEKSCHVTRFVALADVKNPLNRKYLYALKLVPIDKMSRSDLIYQPPDVTENPFRELMEQSSPLYEKETEVQTDQYFYEVNPQRSEPHSRKRRLPVASATEDTSEVLKDDSPPVHHDLRKKRAESLKEKLDKPREQAACWFCLGNPQVKSHLIVSVNTQAYLALPRGPLVTDHVLILTVGHHRSWTTCPDYVRSEIEDYKGRLKRMFTDQGRAMVAFERNLRTQHYQLQIIPIPFAVAGEVKQAFIDQSIHSETSPCILQPIPRNTELNEICSPGVPYFYVELPTGERLFGQIKKDRIPVADIQFGRFVLTDSRILDCPDRADWRNCIDDVEEETRLAVEMRNRFAAYDVD